jgi:hypothetical protein
LQNPAQGEITQLLSRWEQGEPEALESLAPLVYDQLRAIAAGFLRNERPDHTLQPTAVVNEVFLDLLRLRRLAARGNSKSRRKKTISRLIWGDPNPQPGLGNAL